MNAGHRPFGRISVGGAGLVLLFYILFFSQVGDEVISCDLIVPVVAEFEV